MAFSTMQRQPVLSKDEGVCTIGAFARSDAEFISQLLERLPGCQVHLDTAAAPARTAVRPPPGLEASLAPFATAMGMAPPPGLEAFAPMHLKSAMRTADEEMSTTDGSGSEHSFGRERTTLMLRNVPVDYTRDMLVEAFGGCYQMDFVYLPRTSNGKTNLSYAFLNFHTEAQAVAFQGRWHKQRLPAANARKALNISFAEVQGLQANVAQLRKKRSRCADESQCQPIVRVNGAFVPFEEAQTIGAF